MAQKNSRGHWPKDFQDIKKNDEFYLDIEDNERRTVFNQPGYNFQTCKPPQCQGVGWPGNDAKITYSGDTEGQLKLVTPPGGNEPVPTLFLKVQYSYETADGKKVQGEGWLAADRLRRQKVQPVFPTKKPPVTDSCKNTMSSPEKMAKEIADECTRKAYQEIEALTDSLTDKIGFCAIPNPPQLPKFNQQVMYDEHVLPKLKTIKDWPRVKKGDGTWATPQDFISIDAVARTLYGEMAVCHRNGLHYPMAVAAIIKNRGKSAAGFFRAKHDPFKAPIAMEATDPSQFHTWKRKSNEQEAAFRQLSSEQKKGRVLYNHSNAEQALCPPASTQKKFYRGHPPHKFEQKIWQDMVKIAAEMVLFPAEFDKRTADIKETNYTSIGACIPNMEPVHDVPLVAGRKLDNLGCIELWRPRKVGSKGPDECSKRRARKPAQK